MGAYLSEPITNKETSVEENDELRVASSSMQGWRVSQEDAHNAIINFDDRTSIFAVYDGHGGHEVAEYTAKKLPSFIKQNLDYQKGNIQKALVDSFIEFDRTIINREVVAELKRIAGKPEDDEAEDEDEMDNLYQEATMPIEEVIAKYEANESGPDSISSTESPGEISEPNIKVLKNPNLAALSSSSGSKGISPFLRAKTNPFDKTGECDESIAKEIDFKEGTISEMTNGNAEEDLIDSEKSNNDESNKDKVKHEVNGQHNPHDANAQANSVSDSTARNKQGNIAGDKDLINETVEDKHDRSSDTNGEIDVSPIESKMKNSKGAEDEKKNGVNGDIAVETTKGKGKGKGKGKSSVISDKTPKEIDSAQQTKPTPRTKRASKSAAELYRKILDDDENGDPIMDEESSDEDVVYGQEESDSDDVEEEDEDGTEEDGEEEQEDSEEEEEDADDDNDNGEDYIGGEFNEEPGNDSGCTAVVALLRGNELFVANAGDSRCVVCRDGKAIEMSFDHKPEDAPERDRIENAGGRVTPDGRVNGGLNLSRAIGDHAYKTNKSLPLQEQMISPVPDIRNLRIDPTKDSYIVLACDGIWNSLTSQEVVDFVSERLDNLSSGKNGTKDPTTTHLQNICEELFEHCLAPDTMNDGTGMDNMTAVIVKLRNTFDGNKSAKNLLPVECSSSAKISPGLLSPSSISTPSGHSEEPIKNADGISSNGDSKQPLNIKRTQESNKEESSDFPCTKKFKLDEPEKPKKLIE